MKSCPTCHLMLQAVDWDGPAAWACSSCGGLWAAAGNAPAVRQRSAELAARFPGTGSAAMYEGLPMSCPECRIVRMDPGEGAGSARWRCAKCGGIWLAAGCGAETVEPEPAAAGGDRAPALEPVAVEAAGSQAARVVEPEPAPVLPAQPPTPPEPLPTLEPERAVVSRLTIEPAATLPTAPRPEPMAAPAEWKPPSTPAEAIECLEAGNRRFAADAATHARQDVARARMTAGQQAPFAAVVTCSDSRVAPEILFDQGIGDLFVVRDAGAIVGATGQAGLAYAVDVLGAVLIVVLGHRRCGAVSLSVQADGHYPYLECIIDEISPAVRSARALSGDVIGLTESENVRRIVTQILDSNWVVAERARDGRIEVVGAIYDVATGRVEFLTDIDRFVDPAGIAGLTSAAPAFIDAAAATPSALDVPGAPAPGPVRLGTPDPEAAPDVHAAGPAPWAAPEPVAAEPALPGATLLTAPAPGPEHTTRAPASGDVTSAMAPSQPGRTQQSLWCPQCRGGFPSTQRYCVRCGVPLVPGAFRVPCLACHRENTIEAARCWACSTDLHPGGPLARSQSRPPKLSPELLRYGSARRSPQSTDSCATQILGALAVIAGLCALPHVVVGLCRVLGLAP